MKCCMSTDFGTWTNWLTFEPDPIVYIGAITAVTLLHAAAQVVGLRLVMCPEICPEICENFCPEIFFGCAQACRYRYRYSADAGTGLLSLISYALQHRILLRRENPTYRYWAPVAAARHGFIHRRPWKHLCRRYVRSTECSSSWRCVLAALTSAAWCHCSPVCLSVRPSVCVYLSVCVCSPRHREGLPIIPVWARSSCGFIGWNQPDMDLDNVT